MALIPDGQAVCFWMAPFLRGSVGRPRARALGFFRKFDLRYHSVLFLFLPGPSPQLLPLCRTYFFWPTSSSGILTSLSCTRISPMLEIEHQIDGGLPLSPTPYQRP